MGWKHLQNSEMTLNCAGINDVQNLWQCAKQGPQVCKNPVSVICKGNTHSHIVTKFSHLLQHISELRK